MEKEEKASLEGWSTQQLKAEVIRLREENTELKSLLEVSEQNQDYLIASSEGTNSEELISSSEETKTNSTKEEKLKIPKFTLGQWVKHYSINKPLSVIRRNVGFDADLVFPRLYLGSHFPALDLPSLKAHHITHIVTCLNNPFPNLFPDDIQYLVLRFPDQMQVNVLSGFKVAFDFLDQVIGDDDNDTSKTDNVVLVHCYAGASRSVTIVVGYIMYKLKIGVEEALALLRKNRPISKPNPSFLEQLVLFENMNFVVDEHNSTYKKLTKNKMLVRYNDKEEVEEEKARQD